jgi:hypothetical protein
MTPCSIPLLVLSLLSADTAPAPKFPIGKDTTYVDGPLDKDGYIDYEAALNERLGKGVTPDKNVMVLLCQAIGPRPEGKARPAAYYKLLGILEPPKDGVYFVNLTDFAKRTLKKNEKEALAIDEQAGIAIERPWQARDFPALAAWLNANEKPLALVVEATRRPAYFNPVLTERVKERGDGDRPVLMAAQIANMQACREFTQALTIRAMLRIGEGKFDDAWQDVLACHRLGRVIGRGATLIDSLVGAAIESIAHESHLRYIDRANLTAKQTQDRLKDLRGLPAVSPLLEKIDIAERYMQFDSVRIARRGGLGFQNALSGEMRKPTAADLDALDQIDWEPTLRAVNAGNDRVVAAMRLKDRGERQQALLKIDADLKKRKSEMSGVSYQLKKIFANKRVQGEMMGDILVTLMTPAVLKVQGAHDRTEQKERNLHVAFALAAYRHDHKKYPARLDDLAPKYLPTVPGDLFSGKALIYRPAANDGYLFYSVGGNGRDDGGRSNDDIPAGDDLPVRMPVPERNREPPDVARSAGVPPAIQAQLSLAAFPIDIP